MPNTLAHLGVQSLLGRGLQRGAPLPWLALGCVLPDAGWILQRVVRALPLGVDPYELRLYAIAQSTLVVVLLLSGAFAALAARPRRVLLLLAFAALVHLLLDATQIKIGNGVHLLAPLSWELFGLGWFWPEDAPSWILTGLGLGVFLYAWPRWREEGVLLVLSPARLVASASLLVLWLALPLTLRAGPEAADNHSVRTLRAPERTGLVAGFDRDRYRVEPNGPVLVTLAGEPLRVVGAPLSRSGAVSARARFVSHDRIEILELHAHRPLGRDMPTYVGLALVAATWLRPGAVRFQLGP